MGTIFFRFSFASNWNSKSSIIVQLSRQWQTIFRFVCHSYLRRNAENNIGIKYGSRAEGGKTNIFSSLLFIRRIKSNRCWQICFCLKHRRGKILLNRFRFLNAIFQLIETLYLKLCVSSFVRQLNESYNFEWSFAPK